MQVDVDASPARGAGVNPEDPPLRWEVSQGDNDWEEAVVLEDLTGGFNYGAGHGRAAAARRARRCSRSAATACTGCAAGSTTRRATAAPRRPTRRRPRSTRSPPRRSARCCPPSHAAQEENEVLGVSDGTPGQTFPLRYKPGAQARDGRDARGPGPGVGRLGGAGSCGRTSSPRRSSTATTSSTRSSGEVELGPAIRETDGGWTQYGAVPPKGALLRFTRYRHGGGRAGNVAAGALSVLRTTLPGVDTVTNPQPGERRRRRRGARARPPARGDGDPHPLPRGHGRGLRVPRRRGVAARRARGLRAAAGHGRPGRAAPRAAALSRPTASSPTTSCVPDEALLQEVSEYLDERRLIGTTRAAAAVQLPRAVGGREPPGLAARRHRARRGGRRARALHVHQPARRRQRDRAGQGWAFGRALNQGELYGVVHAVDGVEFVKILRIYETNLQTGEQSAKPAGSHIVLEPDELLASAQHIVKATHREA